MAFGDTRASENDAAFWVAAIAGAIVGASVALLLAPKKGAAMREELSDSLAAFKEAAGRRFHELSERAAAELAHLEERADELAGRVGSSAREAVDAASAAAADVRRNVRTRSSAADSL